MRNESRRIGEALRSAIAGRSRRGPLEFVVVDDASDDGCCDGLHGFVRGEELSLTVVKLKRWRGIPAARNVGASKARHPLLFITDANVIFPEGWDGALAVCLDRRTLIAATIADHASNFHGYGCQLLLPSLGVTWIPVPHAYDGFAPVAACTGTGISAALFRLIGGYDESLPYYGAAEAEFSVRAWLFGARILSAPKLVFRHHFRPADIHATRLAALDAIMVRNALRFACYYLPHSDLVASFAYYSSSPHYPAAWHDLENGDVWARRATLASMPRNFQWYRSRFSIASAS